MYNFTVPMALMDYLPAFFFGVTFAAKNGNDIG